MVAPGHTPTHAHTSPLASPSYPVNLDLDGRAVLVVGGGRVAVRKVAGLRMSGAVITVVAPAIRAELRGLADVEIIERTYRSLDLDDQWLVITCTDDDTVNAEVAADAQAARVWANSADDPARCAFTLPAVARQGDLSLAISTSGKSPALASWLRRRFESEFDTHYLTLLELLTTTRAEVRATFGTSEVSGWIEGLDDGLLELIRDGQTNEARLRLRSYVGLDDLSPHTYSPEPAGAAA